MTRAIRLLGAVMFVGLLAPAVDAATETKTTGKVCGSTCPQRRLEQFGAYTFKGKTTPSKRGHVVVFHFKRAGTERWRRFRVGPADGRNAFFVLNRDRPRTRINARNRWRIQFTPGVRPGRYVLRAKFLRQDGFRASATKVRVRVRKSD